MHPYHSRPPVPSPFRLPAKWGGGFYQTFIPGYTASYLGATASHCIISATNVTAYNNSAGECDAYAASSFTMVPCFQFIASPFPTPVGRGGGYYQHISIYGNNSGWDLSLFAANVTAYDNRAGRLSVLLALCLAALWMGRPQREHCMSATSTSGEDGGGFMQDVRPDYSVGPLNINNAIVRASNVSVFNNRAGEGMQ
jgi:hypothetical protein